MPGGDPGRNWYGFPNIGKKSYAGNYGDILGHGSGTLPSQKESQILERHLKPDRVQVLISVPPNDSVSQVVASLNGTSAIHIARVYLGKRKSFTRQHIWARGYFVSDIGMDEETIRKYIIAQEKEDRRLAQMNLFQD